MASNIFLAITITFMYAAPLGSSPLWAASSVSAPASSTSAWKA